MAKINSEPLYESRFNDPSAYLEPTDLGDINQALERLSGNLKQVAEQKAKEEAPGERNMFDIVGYFYRDSPSIEIFYCPICAFTPLIQAGDLSMDDLRTWQQGDGLSTEEILDDLAGQWEVDRDSHPQNFPIPVHRYEASVSSKCCWCGKLLLS